MIDVGVQHAVAHATILLSRCPADQQYVFWVVHRDAATRELWCDYVRKTMAAQSRFQVIGLDGSHMHGIRGHTGIYCLWDYATCNDVSYEIKTALALTFATTISHLRTSLIYHQMIVGTPNSESEPDYDPG